MNESWIEKDGTNNVTGPWHILIACISVLGFATAITLTSFMYLWFGTPATSGQDCGLYTFFTTFNLIMWLFLTGVSFKVSPCFESTYAHVKFACACVCTR